MRELPPISSDLFASTESREGEEKKEFVPWFISKLVFERPTVYPPLTICPSVTDLALQVTKLSFGRSFKVCHLVDESIFSLLIFFLHSCIFKRERERTSSFSLVVSQCDVVVSLEFYCCPFLLDILRLRLAMQFILSTGDWWISRFSLLFFFSLFFFLFFLFLSLSSSQFNEPLKEAEITFIFNGHISRFISFTFLDTSYRGKKREKE